MTVNAHDYCEDVFYYDAQNNVMQLPAGETIQPQKKILILNSGATVELFLTKNPMKRVNEPYAIFFKYCIMCGSDRFLNQILNSERVGPGKLPPLTCERPWCFNGFPEICSSIEVDNSIYRIVELMYLPKR